MCAIAQPWQCGLRHSHRQRLCPRIDMLARPRKKRVLAAFAQGSAVTTVFVYFSVQGDDHRSCTYVFVHSGDHRSYFSVQGDDHRSCTYVFTAVTTAHIHVYIYIYISWVFWIHDTLSSKRFMYTRGASASQSAGAMASSSSSKPDKVCRGTCFSGNLHLRR